MTLFWGRAGKPCRPTRSGHPPQSSAAARSTPTLPCCPWPLLGLALCFPQLRPATNLAPASRKKKKREWEQFVRSHVALLLLMASHQPHFACLLASGLRPSLQSPAPVAGIIDPDERPGQASTSDLLPPGRTSTEYVLVVRVARAQTTSCTSRPSPPVASASAASHP